MTEIRLPDALDKLIQSDVISPEAMRLLWATVRANLVILVYGHDQASIESFGELIASLLPEKVLPIYRLANDSDTIVTSNMLLLYELPKSPSNPDILLFLARHYHVRLLVNVEKADDSTKNPYEVVKILQRAAPTSDSVVNLAAINKLQTLYERYQPSNELKFTGVHIDFIAKLDRQDMNTPLTVFGAEDDEISSTQETASDTDTLTSLDVETEVTPSEHLIDESSQSDDMQKVDDIGRKKNLVLPAERDKVKQLDEVKE